MIAKGHDWVVKVFVGGQQEAVFRAFTSVTIDFGLGVEEHEYVGEDAPRVNGVNGSAKITLPFDVDSAAYVRLLSYQQQKNGPNATRLSMRIDATAAVDFADEGRTRVRFSDCTLHDAQLMVQGRVEQNTNSSPVLTARRWRRID